ncbi:hypothetical protein FKP32DRAFT_53992 [Trametes sanguinea]|nr:hypothetical protein FKP32DRAFT_53992 [Trametes sanguinea]
MAKTRRVASARRRQQPAEVDVDSDQRQHFMRLPPELRRMIFECFESRRDDDERCGWFRQTATVCKTFQEEVEAVLYRSVDFSSCKEILGFRYALLKRPARSTSVRQFSLVLGRHTKSARKPLKRILKMLTNLISFEICVNDPAIFELLLDVPFQLRSFHVFGSTFPACMEAILASQPSLLFFEHQLTVRKGDQATFRDISRQNVLPNLRSLAVDLSHFSLSLIKHPFPSLTRLSLRRAQHEDIAHALTLFSGNLVSFKVDRVINEICTSSCYWPTSIIKAARLPRLLHLEVTDNRGYGHRKLQLDMNMDEATPSSLRAACPELKKFVWGTDPMTLRGLAKDLSLQRERWTVLDEYAGMLLSTFTQLQRVCVKDTHSFKRGPDGESLGKVYMRAEDGQRAKMDKHCIVGPAGEWRKVPDGPGSHDLAEDGTWGCAG